MRSTVPNESVAGIGENVIESNRLTERYYMASQWELMRRKFIKHRLARVSMVILAFLYGIAIFAEFVAPYGAYSRSPNVNMAPALPRFRGHDGSISLRPFVYGVNREFSRQTMLWEFSIDTSQRYYLRFFVRGDSYRMWGVWESDLHLFGVDKGGFLNLFGTDALGRDLLSRIIYASRVSLSIGLVGVFLSFILGVTLGGLAGYLGGRTDMIISRLIEFLTSLPSIPIWLMIAAAVPIEWDPLVVYLMITIILSVVGWTGLARVVRGKFLELREEDYVLAARAAGADAFTVIRRHLVPGFISYLIVSITLSVPGMILGESTLSFLGLGLRAPVISWGVLLSDAINFRTVVVYPWLMLPGVAIVITVLAFNFVGDGLRDAADPYHS